MLFASALSDTQLGNQQFLFTNNLVNSASGLGGKLSDSGFLILSFLLNPGELLQLGDGNPEVLLRGAAIPACSPAKSQPCSPSTRWSGKPPKPCRNRQPCC